MVHEIAFRIGGMDFADFADSTGDGDYSLIIRDVAEMNLERINAHIYQKLMGQTSVVGRASTGGWLFRNMANDHSRIVLDNAAPTDTNEYMIPVMRPTTFGISDQYPQTGLVSFNDQDEWSIWKKSPAIWAHVTESRRNFVLRNPDKIAAWGTDVLVPVATMFMRAIAKQHAAVVTNMGGGGDQATIKFWLYDLSKIDTRDLVRDLNIDGFPNLDDHDEMAHPGTQALARQVKRVVAGEILRAVQEGRRIYYQHHANKPQGPKKSLLTHSDKYRGLTAQLMVNFWQEAELSFPQQARHTERRVQLRELHIRRMEITQNLLTALNVQPSYVIDPTMTAAFVASRPPVWSAAGYGYSSGPASTTCYMIDNRSMTRQI